MSPLNIPDDSKAKTKTYGKDNFYFSAYLNLARHNAFIVLADISRRLNLRFNTGDEGNLLTQEWYQVLSTVKKPELQLQLIELLTNHFRFLQPYTDIKNRGGTALARDYALALQEVINKLIAYRNFTSHAIHEPVSADKQFAKNITKLFVASRIAAKERFKYSAEDVKHMAHGKNIYDSNFKYALLNYDYTLSEKGIVFLACLFLNNKQSRLFLSQIKGIKDARTKATQATFNTFVQFGIALPRVRLQSSNSTSRLLLDVLNEIKRCPKILFEALDDTNKERFRGETIHEDDELPEPYLVRHTNRFFYQALRFIDESGIMPTMRFQVDLGNYHYYSYQKNINADLRSVTLVKKMTSFARLHEFENIDQPDDWKQLQINATEKEIKNDTDIYVSPTYPHYHIVNNNIGIKITSPYERAAWPALTVKDIAGKHFPQPPKTEKPACWLSLQELPAIIFYSSVIQGLAAVTPADEIIKNHHKKMRLFFDEILQCTSINAIIQAKEKAGIADKQLPDIIVKMIREKTTSRDLKINNKLKRLLTDNERRLNFCENLPKKNTKKLKDRTAIRSGEIADFLARDILQLQPGIYKDASGEILLSDKANGLEFQIMQAKIAFFGRDLQELPSLFEHLKLINSVYPHPFLHKINLQECSTILDFYKSYLTERKNFLSNIKDCSNDKLPYFLRLSNKEEVSDINSLKQYVTNLLNQPLSLPRSLFYEPIKNALLNSAVVSTRLKDIIKESNECNTFFLIKKYYEIELHDEIPGYYNLPRSYDILNRLFDKRPFNSSYSIEKQFFTRDEIIANYKLINEAKTKLYERKKANPKNVATAEAILKATIYLDKTQLHESNKANPKNVATVEAVLKAAIYHDIVKMYETEKRIRLYEVCDLLSMSMAGYLLKKQNVSVDIEDHQHVFLLKNIFATGKSNILDLTINNTFAITDSEGRTKQIIQSKVKIKDSGKVRKYLTDRRLTQLLSYLHEESIPSDYIEKELDAYDKIRIDIAENLLNFESRAVNLIPELTTALKNNRKTSDSKSHIGYKEILDKISENPDMKLKAIDIRNAFNHNQYPTYSLFKNQVNIQNNELVANKFYDIIKDTHDHFIANFSN